MDSYINRSSEFKVSISPISSRKAFIILCTTDAYAVGASVLAQSIRSSSSHFPVYCLCTENLSSTSKILLLSCTDELIQVPILNSKSLENLERLERMNRPDLISALTKLHVWSLDGHENFVFVISSKSLFHKVHWENLNGYHGNSHTYQSSNVSLDCLVYNISLAFDRVVYMDADMLVIQNIDELLLNDELYHGSFAAAPDIGWPDIFNSGLMVLCPNRCIYKELMYKMTASNSSFDGADQGILNQYYSSWSKASHSEGPYEGHARLHRLPFTYNTAFCSIYSYDPAFQRFKKDIKVVHFLGATGKPWLTLCYNTDNFSTESGIPKNSPGDGNRDLNLNYFFDYWWSFYAQSSVSHIVGMLGGLQKFQIYRSPKYGTISKSFHVQNISLPLNEVKNDANYGNFCSSHNEHFSIHPSVSGSYSNSMPDSSKQHQQSFSQYKVHWPAHIQKAFDKQKNLELAENEQSNIHHELYEFFPISPTIQNHSFDSQLQLPKSKTQ